MYTKNLLSVAAAVAVLSTGALAFDSVSGKTSGAEDVIKIDTNNSAAVIVTQVGEEGKKHFILSSYEQSSKADTNLTLSNDFKGDALIYPAFNQKDGWGTEITVRNTSANAIVAKAVLYDGTDSHEAKDFNIYLSAHDVCRFRIENGKVTSTDGSIKTYGARPHFVDSNTTRQDVDRTDYALAKFANDKDYPFDSPLTEKTGYVIIYGMEQTTGINNNGFHGDHAGLYASYARSLDVNRSTAYSPLTVNNPNGNGARGWRNVKNESVASITNGMFVANVNKAPNVNGTATVTWNKWYEKVQTGGANLVNPHIRQFTTTFTPVGEVLTGQVRIYNKTAGNDMLLNAKALTGFTDATHRLLWAPGEYASIADRCIDTNNTITAAANENNTTVFYDRGCLANDANNFRVTSAVYTFANATGDVKENKLLVTQPYKRILAQFGNVSGFGGYQGSSDVALKYDIDTDKYQNLATGTKYYFTVDVTNTYDEDENQQAQDIGGTIITSPASTSSNPDKFNHELQEINAEDMEKNPGFKGAFDAKNGFTNFALTIPAITTQMVGSALGSVAQMNWVYTDNN